MSETIPTVLQDFEPISLSEMDSVALMERTDTKYAFNLALLPSLLNEMKKSYQVLEVNGHRLSRYESLYFDTLNFDLFKKHLTGRLNRYKIRYRSYVESNLHFFEVKFKNNKGRTLKKRIAHNWDEKIDGMAEQFFRKYCTIDPSSLEYKLRVHFSRMTFVNKFSPERVTIDLHLSFINKEQTKMIGNLVIAEVKQERHFVSSFVRLMKDHHIRSGGLSKYCQGVISLFPKERYNSFKPELLLLKKIINDTTPRT